MGSVDIALSVKVGESDVDMREATVCLAFSCTCSAEPL